MKTKKEDKVCLICNLAIDPSKEFCKFIYYEKENKVKSEGYYHVNCFRYRLSGSEEMNKIQRQAKEILNKIGAIV